MPPIRLPSPVRAALLALVLLPLAGTAWAQQKIEQQMTPEQFRATGLDRLSPEQLANLNDWLQGKLQLETAKAVEVAKQEQADDRRGLFERTSNEPIAAKLDGEFSGFGRGQRFTLDNGQVWQQVDDASLTIGRVANPQVKVTPGIIGASWYLSIEGYNTRAKVQRVK